jgi:hypothetical protein
MPSSPEFRRKHEDFCKDPENTMGSTYLMRKYNVSRSAINKWKHELHLPLQFQRKPLTAEEVKKLIQALHDDPDLDTAPRGSTAVKHNITLNQLFTLLRKMGKTKGLKRRAKGRAPETQKEREAAEIKLLMAGWKR